MDRKFHRTIRISVTLLVMVVLLTACGAPSGSPEDGKRWFMMHNCWSCHGKNGNDGRAPEITNLSMSFGSFLRKLRTTDAPIMPPFPETKLSEQDAADIYAFLNSAKE